MKNSTNLRPLTIALLLCLLMSVARHLLAQGSAVVNGTATDVSLAALSKVQVVLTNLDTSQVRINTTSDVGFFEFTDLKPGNYSVKVIAQGFKIWEQASVGLTVAQHLTVYPQLAVGSANEHVEVTTNPPLITTSNSNISQVVDAVQIAQLPLNGRNTLQLVALAPGVISTGTAGQFGATQITFASSGGRDIDTNYSLDGGFNENTFYSIANPYPNPDALQEFAVITRNYSATFGRGSTDVSAVTRSGTNNFHGSLFEFIRNTNLNTKPYFATARPNFHRNQFGGSFGGPMLPHRLFFFVSYQGTQQTGGPGNQTYTTVPLPQRAGDFSALTTPVIDPKTGKQFPGNVIPSARINPQAIAFFQKFLPPPNQGANTYSFPNVGTLHEHQAVAKVDYQLSQRDLVFVRYFMDDVPQVAYASGSGSALDTTWVSDLPTRFQNTTAGYVHTFSPKLLNNLHVSYVRSYVGVMPKINFSLANLGYGINTANALTQYGLTPDARLSITGAFTAYPGAPTRDIIDTSHLVDSVSITRANHTLSLGTEFYKNRINETQNFNTGGNFTFNGQFTGVGAADFLIGQFSSFAQISSLSARLHQTLPSFYVQDDVKVSPRLTLSVGLRWDIASGFNSENNQLISLQPGRQSTVFPLATPGLLFPGDAGIPKDVVGTRWNNLAPRLGVAWDVLGNGRTSVRGGFGTFFVPLSRGITLNRLTLIQPYTLQVGLSGGDAENIFAAAPFNGVNPFPRPSSGDINALKNVPFIPTAGESSLPLIFKTEASYEWSLSIQQGAWKNATIETDFVGSSSSHLTTSAESNPALYVPGASTVANTQSRRLYPQIGSINSILNVLSANYSSLQIVFNQQFTRGFFTKSAYTWSKAMGVGGAQTEGTNGPRNPFNYYLDYGPLDADVTHNWVSSLVWRPLESREMGTFARALIGGWQLGGIASLHTGLPMNLTSGRDNSLTGIGNDTPDVIADYHLSNHSRADAVSHWFNQAAFTQNKIGTFGMLGHNALRKPGFVNVDVNLQKNFKVGEQSGLEFRSSFYNAFNHANLGAPTTVLTSANFGRITTSTDPRVLEFGLRLTF